MGIIRTYFREHTWQRRALTALLGVIIACLLSIWLVPIYLDHYWIDKLGSADPKERHNAIAKLWDLAEQRPATRDRLIDALDTPSDLRFSALQEILASGGHWPPPQNAELWQDRLRAIEFEGMAVDPALDPARRAEAQRAATHRRRVILHEAILSNRDNPYLRRILAAAVDIESADVRAAAATLAARLADWASLEKLLDDPAPQVASTAILLAGLSEKSEFADAVRRLLYRTMPRLQIAARQADPDDAQPPIDTLRNLAANCCLALLRFSEKPQEAKTTAASDRLIANIAIETDDPALREQLLWLLSDRPRDEARRAVHDIAARYRWQGKPVPAAVLLAARRLGMPDQTAAALDILTRAADANADGLLTSQLIAAIDYALATNLPCRKQAYDIVRRYWSPNQPVLLSRAARLLGRQATLDAGQAPDAPTADACLQLLRQVVVYATVTETDGETVTQTTPFASAHAAVAQWLAQPSDGIYDVSEIADAADLIELTPKSGFYLQQAAAVATSDPGDVIAWQLARSHQPQARGIGDAFLPPRGSRFPEYNEEVRSAGMMLLALAAPDSRRADITQRIQQHLASEGFYGRNAARCALLMLGKQQYLESVRVLIGAGDFSRRRAVTALLVAGDRWTLDLLLWNVSWPLDDVTGMLTALDVNSIFEVTVPQLPRPQAAVTPGTQLWQVEVMRQLYALFREQIRVGGRP